MKKFFLSMLVVIVSFVSVNVLFDEPNNVNAASMEIFSKKGDKDEPGPMH